MIKKIIEFSSQNKFMVFAEAAAVSGQGKTGPNDTLNRGIFHEIISRKNNRILREE